MYSYYSYLVMYARWCFVNIFLFFICGIITIYLFVIYLCSFITSPNFFLFNFFTYFSSINFFVEKQYFSFDWIRCLWFANLLFIKFNFLNQLPLKISVLSSSCYLVSSYWSLIMVLYIYVSQAFWWRIPALVNNTINFNNILLIIDLFSTIFFNISLECFFNIEFLLIVIYSYFLFNGYQLSQVQAFSILSIEDILYEYFWFYNYVERSRLYSFGVNNFN